jgi:hypothetical protein
MLGPSTAHISFEVQIQSTELAVTSGSRGPRHEPDRHVVPSGQMEPSVHDVVQPSEVQVVPAPQSLAHAHGSRDGGLTRRQPRPSQK